MARIQPHGKLLKRRIAAAKEQADLLTVARGLGAEVEKKGQRHRGKCPLCGSGARSGAFSVDAERQLFHCHSCGVGGDVVRLIESWGDYSAEWAVAWLGHTYGLDLPERPESWYRKQDRQARLREKLEAERREVFRRRLFRYVMLPVLETISEERERKRETDVAWERFERLPL